MNRGRSVLGSGDPPRIPAWLNLAAGNLYHFGARYYNPASTTWTQQDPINQPNDLTQADRYLYAGLDPINLRDIAGLNATGLSSVDACGLGGLFFGATSGGTGAIPGCYAATAANDIINAIF